VKSLHRFTVCLCLLVVFGVTQSRGAFNSLYIFGDGVSTTTNQNSSTPERYYEKRFCNGRVWVEVIAQWQGLSYDSNKNWSYFGHYSSNLKTNVQTFEAPADASNALFVVWVNNADFVNNLGTIFPPYGPDKIAPWTNALNQSLTNHANAIQTLYNKGARTLLMPNAVDMTKVPQYAGLSAANKTFVRLRTLEFNTNFTAVLSNATATLPGLQIIQPDIFTLLDQIHANPTNFTLIVPALAPTDYAWGYGYTVTSGPGTNFVFWDAFHPTAKFQMYIAEKAQQLLSPARISDITSVNTSNQLNMANLPVGRDGVVEVSTNFLNWSTAANITSTNLNQSIMVNAPGEHGYYRLRFPFLWSWP
jgi:phospholipase/lecithinase/hemolysin